MTTQIDFEQARLNMIEQQIRTWEVLDQSVLDLLNEHHREEFVPAEFRALALADINIPLAHAQVMMTPKLEARLLQSLTINSQDSVLEIGTGSGYLTTLLSEQAAHVCSLDIYEDFTNNAELLIKNNEKNNIQLVNADAFNFEPIESGYDVIAVTGSVATVPEIFKQQLNINGRMFIVVGESPVMEAQLIRRVGENDWATESLFETVIPALIGAESVPSFRL